MLEGEYRFAKGMALVIHFISFIIAVIALPYIQKLLAGKLTGILLLGATYLIAFVLMMWAIPWIILQFWRS